jgi:hypothetical protein
VVRSSQLLGIHLGILEPVLLCTLVVCSSKLLGIHLWNTRASSTVHSSGPLQPDSWYPSVVHASQFHNKLQWSAPARYLVYIFGIREPILLRILVVRCYSVSICGILEQVLLCTLVLLSSKFLGIHLWYTRVSTLVVHSSQLLGIHLWYTRYPSVVYSSKFSCVFKWFAVTWHLNVVYSSQFSCVL